MGEQKGVEAIKDAAGTIIGIGATLVKDLADGKITLPEGFEFLPQLMKVPGIVTQWPEIKAEWADRSPAELDELDQYFKDAFSIPNGKVEAVIEKALSVLKEIVELADLVKAMKAE